MDLVIALRRSLLRRWGPAPLRDHLAITILAASLPLIALMSYLLLEQARTHEATLKANMVRIAETRARGVDAKLQASIDALRIVARSATSFDPAGTRARLIEIQQLRPAWNGLFVLDADGDVLLDTATDRDSASATPSIYPDLSLPAPGSDWVVVTRPRGDRYAAVILVPMGHDAATRSFLGTRVDVSELMRPLESAPSPAERYYGLVDAGYRRVASSIAGHEHIGEVLPATTVAAMKSARSGITKTIAPDGREHYVAWHGLETVDWTLEIGAPAAVVDSAFRSALFSAMLIGGTSLLTGLALAVPLARRIIVPLRKLARRGPAGLPQGSSIHEIQMLRDDLASAAGITQAAQQRLQEALSELRIIFETSPVGLAFAEDTSGSATRTNEAYDRMTNRNFGSIGVQVLAQGQPLPREELPLLRAARRGESVRDLELELVAPDGQRTFLLANAIPLRDAEGLPRGAIGAIVDITARKQIEAQLLETDRQLRESRDQIELARESANVGFFHYRFDSDTAIWSPWQAKLFEAGSEMPASGSDPWPNTIHPADVDDVNRALRESHGAREAKTVIEYRVLSEGAPRWVSTRITTVYDAQGRPSKMTGFSMDVTELKAAELAREKLAEQEQIARVAAEAANRSKDQFLAMLGHELRNPLGAMTTAVAVLERVEPGSPAAAEAKTIIGRQTITLRRLIDDLLDVARVVSGKIALERHPLNLAELVRRSAAVRVEDNQGRARVALDLGDAWIDGDWIRIEQILNNLIGNAIKHSSPGDRITVVVRAVGEAVYLEVIDEGPGIPAALLESIFDPFVQGDRSIDRRGGGLGIGLTLVRHLVRLHGGTVAATSSEAGTTMSVRFDAIAPESDHARMLEAGVPAQSRTVLVIEDNADARNALRTMLELEGHTVRVSETGVEGLANLLSVNPDAAVVDIGLPEISGIEIARRGRAAGYAGLLIALSGYTQEEDRKLAREAGFDAHLTKPVSMSDLLRLIGRSVPGGGKPSPPVT